jgi:ribosomal protein S18 acetylase RimI-like enzyme
MAARLQAMPSASTPDLVDLRQISAAELNPVLDEEIQTWAGSLDWDFTKSADLVRRFLDMRALNGFALLEAGEVIGYVYHVFEEHKALVGDLYVRSDRRTIESENRLLNNSLHAMISAGHVHRIESQLMMLSSEVDRPVPEPQFASAYERNFMMLDYADAPLLAQGRMPRRVYIEKWSEHHQEDAAQLIASAYAGHVDSRINDQYRSLAGARRFLFNIVQYPGCGLFFKPASFIGLDMETGKLSGMSLSSIVNRDCGHITQICVSPSVRGAGLGYELLRNSLAVLKTYGCRRATLTVTASNAEAISLYENVGFRTLRRFSAYVWEGF